MVNSIFCPVCQNLCCSSQAASCPKCGHPINQNNQTVAAENANLNNPPRSASAGSYLRGVLWAFFAISLIYSFGALNIWRGLPPRISTYNDSRILADKIAIAFRLAPLIIMIIVLAITYSSKERR